MCQIKLGQVFKFARRKRYLTFNPLLEDPIKLSPRDRERPWVPGWDLMDCIIERGQRMRPAHVNGYSRLLWSNTKVGNALGGGAGLQISEAVALAWDRRPGDEDPCVDFANRVLHVRWACTSRGDFDRPKKKKIRDVPISQWVYDALFEHMHVLQTLGITLEGPVIYNSRNPGRPCTPDQWGVKLRKFLVQAGVLEISGSERRLALSRSATVLHFGAICARSPGIGYPGVGRSRELESHQEALRPCVTGADADLETPFPGCRAR